MEEFVRDQVRRLKPLPTILQYVCAKFGKDFCLRTLKRFMSEQDIRYYDYVDPETVIHALQEELASPRANAGIRRMQLRLRIYHGLLVTRRQVWDALTLIDPERLQQNRRRKLKRRQYCSLGSNYTWHIDQHDKIREFGICIHGCVDGFSRKILWLEAYTKTNSSVVAKYFYTCIKNGNVIPARVRSDHGTENTTVAQMQLFLRRNHVDDYCYNRSFMYGPSQYNQPIENMWSRFREDHEQFWINIFKELKEQGYWQYDVAVDKWCLLYVFLPLVKRGLCEYMESHNSHRIRKQRNAARPHGIPEDMYNFPVNFGGHEMGFEPFNADLAAVVREFNLEDPLPDFMPIVVYDALSSWIVRTGVIVTIQNATDVYKRLRHWMNMNIV